MNGGAGEKRNGLLILSVEDWTRENKVDGLRAGKEMEEERGEEK